MRKLKTILDQKQLSNTTSFGGGGGGGGSRSRSQSNRNTAGLFCRGGNFATAIGTTVAYGAPHPGVKAVGAGVAIAGITAASIACPMADINEKFN